MNDHNSPLLLTIFRVYISLNIALSRNCIFLKLSKIFQSFQYKELRRNKIISEYDKLSLNDITVYTRVIVLNIV